MSNKEAVNILEKLVATQKCVSENCKTEYKKMKKITEKFQQKIDKISKDLKKNKITSDEWVQKISDFTIEMYETTQRFNLVKCQADKCQKETKVMVLASLDEFISEYKRGHPMHKFAAKYKKLFKNHVKAEDIQTFDIEFQKIKHHL